MVKNKYGRRYQCFKCGCKFYDLNKAKAVCPKCKADQANAPHKQKTTHAIAHKEPVIPEEELSEDVIPGAEEEEELRLGEEEFPIETGEEDEF